MSKRHDPYGCHSDYEYERILDLLLDAHQRNECASDCLWCEAELEAGLADDSD